MNDIMQEQLGPNGTVLKVKLPTTRIAKRSNQAEDTQILQSNNSYWRISTGILRPVAELSHQGAQNMRMENLFVFHHDDAPSQSEALKTLLSLANADPSLHKSMVNYTDSLKLLLERQTDSTVKTLAVTLLGVLAAGNVEHRDRLLQDGAMDVIRLSLQTHSTVGHWRATALVLCSFCQVPVFAHLNLMKPALFTFKIFCEKSDDTEILLKTCQGIAFFSDGGNENIQMILDQGIVPLIEPLMLHSDPAVQMPAVFAIANMACASEEQICHFATPRLLLSLNQVIDTRAWDPSIRMHACRALHNLAVSATILLSPMLTHGTLLVLIPILADPHAPAVMRLWVIRIFHRVLTAMTEPSDVPALLRIIQGCGVQAICHLLSVPDVEPIKLALDCIQRFLSLFSEIDVDGNGTNIVVETLFLSDALDKIEDLQSHEDEEIYMCAVHILEAYFLEGDLLVVRGK